MRVLQVVLCLIVSFNAAAQAKPCLTEARKIVKKNLSAMSLDADCQIKVSKVTQSEELVSYFADISCVNDGGFFDLTDFVLLKYRKLASGKYECKQQ